MKRKCDACHRPYEAKTKRSKYCARTDCVRSRTRDRVRTHRAPDKKENVVVAFPKTPGLDETVDGDGHRVRAVEAATVAELKLCGRLDSALGEMARALARKIDFGVLDTGSSFASMVRELRATLGEATQGAAGEADPIDELRERRKVKTGRGA